MSCAQHVSYAVLTCTNKYTISKQFTIPMVTKNKQQYTTNENLSQIHTHTTATASGLADLPPKVS